MKSIKDRMKKDRTTPIFKLIRNIMIVFILLILIVFIALTYVKDAKNMISEADTLKMNMDVVLASVKSNNPDGAESAILRIDASSKRLNEILSERKWRAVSYIPLVGRYVKSADTLVNVITDTSNDVLKPAIEVIKQYPLAQLKVGDGFNVNTINAYLDYLEFIEPKIEDITKQMQGVTLPFGQTKRISDYTKLLSGLTDAYKENGEYLPLFRFFLGDGSDKLYLLVAQNSSEIRASGGFPGSIGTIRIQNGVLSIGDFQTVYKVLSERVPAEAGVTEHEKNIFSNWMRLSRDVCYDPDFERVGKIWALSYESRNKEHVNGVISLTPVIIQKLLAYTGPVTLSDGTELNGDNATKVLQKELYYKYLSDRPLVSVTDAGEYVDSLFAETAKTVMGKLVSDFDINRISQYSKIFTDGGKDRTILMWMEDETAQSYVRAAGCSGGLNTDSANPEAGVYFSCSYASKMGWFINLDTEVSEPVINADGSCTYDMTVVMSNAITDEDIYNAGSYILGDHNGGIKGYIHLFAPAGGTISDISASNSMKMLQTEYEGLWLAYNLDFVVYANKPVTITYKVTTAPGVSTPLKVSKTPTLQDYR